MAHTMRVTNREARHLVNAAVNSGRTPPWRRPYWRQAIAGGGPAAGQAIAQLVAMRPAPADVVAGWNRDPRTRRAHAAAAAQDDTAAMDDVYARLYPTDEQAAVEQERRVAQQARDAGRYSMPGARTDNRLRLPEAQAGVPVYGHGDDELELPPELRHGAVSVVHSHPHSDYTGGTHEHEHAHLSSALHKPAAGVHAHPDPEPVPLADAAAAGIAARQARRARAGDRHAHDTDDQLLERLFGRPAGQ
jgi:hypothetical protein